MYFSVLKTISLSVFPVENHQSLKKFQKQAILKDFLKIVVKTFSSASLIFFRCS
jgi:hypothetical protein